MGLRSVTLKSSLNCAQHFQEWNSVLSSHQTNEAVIFKQKEAIKRGWKFRVEEILSRQWTFEDGSLGSKRSYPASGHLMYEDSFWL